MTFDDRHSSKTRVAGALPAALLVTEIYPPTIGGSGVLLRNVYKRLSDVPVTVLTENSPRWPGSDEHVSVSGCRLHAREWGMSSVSAASHHWRVAREIRRRCRRPTVVHCARALPEGVGALLARRVLLGPRFVCWAHGEDIATALGSRELTLLMKQAYRSGASVIANSRNTAQLLEQIGVERSKVHVVYPGVDSARFRPGIPAADLRNQLAPGGGPLLLSVGRLQDRKGHDLVVGALPMVRRTHPNVRYAIVGNGDARARLEELVARTGVSECVVFCGEVAEDDLPRYYAASDVFVLPNRTEGRDIEGFGIVFIEAGASGLPAIGGRSGGVPEAIEEGTTGLLVGGTDVGELACSILQLIGSPDLRARMGAEGRRRAEQDFTWDRAAAAVRDIHDEAAHA